MKESNWKSFKRTKEKEKFRESATCSIHCPREGRGEEKAKEGGRERQIISRGRRVGRQKGRECEMEAAAQKKKYIY